MSLDPQMAAESVERFKQTACTNVTDRQTTHAMEKYAAIGEIAVAYMRHYMLLRAKKVTKQMSAVRVCNVQKLRLSNSGFNPYPLWAQLVPSEK